MKKQTKVTYRNHLQSIIFSWCEPEQVNCNILLVLLSIRQLFMLTISLRCSAMWWRVSVSSLQDLTCKMHAIYVIFFSLRRTQRLFCFFAPNKLTVNDSPVSMCLSTVMSSLSDSHSIITLQLNSHIPLIVAWIMSHCICQRKYTYRYSSTDRYQ